MTTGSIARVAVLGAGVMGSQIAALLANVGCRVDLLDLAGESDQDRPAAAGLERALKARPPAFFVPEMASMIETGSFEDLSVLQQADWIIEAIVEDLEAKRALHARIEAVASNSAIITTNTSGLSISSLSQGRSQRFRSRFLATHFFNPPRYMKLVELVPGPFTDPSVIARLSGYIEETLGKGVVICRDTPNFIANRLGVFAIMDVLHRMEREGVTVEEADAVTGELIGRPKSATLRLCDLIGLDTLVNVARTARENLPDDTDRHVFEPPAFVQLMVETDLLGEKKKAGFYRKDHAGIQALDLHSLQFRDRQRVEFGGKLATAVSTMDLGERLCELWDDETPLGRFVREHLLSTLTYTATIAGDIASDVTQIDRAMKLGFNWKLGPFQIMDALGVERIVNGLERRGQAIPTLLLELRGSGGEGFYVPAPERERGSDGLAYGFEVAGHISVSRATNDEDLLSRSEIIEENVSAQLLRVDDDVGVILFRGRMNVISDATLELVRRATADNTFATLVLFGDRELFSAGADLKFVMSMIEASNWRGLERYVKDFQQATMAVRFAPMPVVAAPRGFALGGGCEFCLAAAARVPAADLQMGLVEVGVGLIPGAGGCKEMVRRSGADIEAAFEVLFAAGISDNAHEARQWGLLDAADPVKMAEDRILKDAIDIGRKLVAQGYEPPLKRPLQVAGQEAALGIDESLERRLASGEIGPHDREVGACLARVLCGVGAGDPEPARGLPGEDEMLDLEREVFLELSRMDATRQRIEHMLKTGKRLRN